MHVRISRSHRQLAIGTLALAAIATTSGLAFAGGRAAPDLSDHGGATRNDGDRTSAVRHAVVGGHARNVILFIGDGMGDSEITVARDYAEGAAGRFKGIDSLPLTGQYTTYSLDKTTGLPDYVPDSAATGSAWSTGTKTYDNAVSVDLAGEPQQTLLELAKQNGLKTGDVTTAEIQDATPAVMVSHISQRSCYGPVKTSATCPEAALENGGLGSITEQLLDTRPDVTLGGGAATFAETAAAGEYAGKTLAEQATSRGYQMVSDKAGLMAVTEADQDKPLLGLFSEGNMPVRYAGPAATVGGSKLPAETCTPNPDHADTLPSLADMTTKAIDLLDNPNGFFLQVEGASIDKQDHAANACGQIGETVDLDEAVQVAMEYARTHRDTSVFVTADHAHSSQIIEVGSTSPGLSVTLTTADGAPMTVNYGTAPAGGSQQHTGSQLRVAGFGPGAANIVGLTDQTDLYFTMRNALGLSDNPSSSKATVQATPSSVRSGRTVTITASKFFADRRATITITGPSKSSATRDVSGGTLVATITPTKAGTYTVTVQGADSGKTAKDTFKVKK
ncbi:MULTISPECIES: alkaline phosphatase [unclassified Nocardioides]|uniref:alkaline phosphatase n=1 Tax=unclassified Nocardioides TaxID=2615069 RepID=UPI0009F045A0|nr:MULTISPECIES: alkaline phosphatase [unclassified Nocardioides]GAW49993.1 Alkaline phosphatase [Nocardioides sp. PD653-B2]GAW55914.1 Alkaline phosphatase [Nocardioides sp. PD653]